MLLRLILRGIAGPLRGNLPFRHRRGLRNACPFLDPLCAQRTQGAYFLPPVALPKTNSRITAFQPREARISSGGNDHDQCELDWLHPTFDSLKAYRSGFLGKQEAQRIKDHLVSCPMCQSDYSFLSK